MKLATTGLAHLALRVTDLARARSFYVDTLGFEPLHDLPYAVVCNAYGTPLVLIGNASQTLANDHFDPYRVGLDHLALGVAGAQVLESIQQELDRAGVAHNGIEQDALTRASYISFYDPDGIAWEFYTPSNGQA